MIGFNHCLIQWDISMAISALALYFIHAHVHIHVHLYVLWRIGEVIAMVRIKTQNLSLLPGSNLETYMYTLYIYIHVCLDIKLLKDQSLFHIETHTITSYNNYNILI